MIDVQINEWDAELFFSRWCLFWFQSMMLIMNWIEFRPKSSYGDNLPPSWVFRLLIDFFSVSLLSLFNYYCKKNKHHRSCVNVSFIYSLQKDDKNIFTFKFSNHHHSNNNNSSSRNQIISFVLSPSYVCLFVCLLKEKGQNTVTFLSFLIKTLPRKKRFFHFLQLMQRNANLRIFFLLPKE